jgi:hypothetical protein
MKKLLSENIPLAKASIYSPSTSGSNAARRFVACMVAFSLLLAGSVNGVQAQSSAANAVPVAHEVSSGNLDKSVNNASGNYNSGQRRVIPEFTATDADGTIASYTIVSVPSIGTIYNGAALLTAGTTIPAGQPLQLSYYAPEEGQYTFAYRATDNGGAVSNTATYYLYVSAVTEVRVEDVEMELDPNVPGRQALAPLKATPSMGAIASFTIASLPEEGSGSLYVNEQPAKPGQVITPMQATQLSFERSASFVSGVSSPPTATVTRHQAQPPIACGSRLWHRSP